MQVILSDCVSYGGIGSLQKPRMYKVSTLTVICIAASIYSRDVRLADCMSLTLYSPSVEQAAIVPSSRFVTDDHIIIVRFLVAY